MSLKSYSPAEAARELGVSLDAIYRLIYAGKLPAQKESDRWLIPQNEVELRAKTREARRGPASR